MTEEEGKRNLDHKEEPVSGKQAERMLLNISGNITGKMGAAKSFESFDSSKIMNCMF